MVVHDSDLLNVVWMFAGLMLVFHLPTCNLLVDVFIRIWIRVNTIKFSERVLFPSMFQIIVDAALLPIVQICCLSIHVNVLPRDRER